MSVCVDKVPNPSDKTGSLKVQQCLGQEFTCKSALITQDCISTLIHIYGYLINRSREVMTSHFSFSQHAHLFCLILKPFCLQILKLLLITFLLFFVCLDKSEVIDSETIFSDTFNSFIKSNSVYVLYSGSVINIWTSEKQMHIPILFTQSRVKTLSHRQ